MRKKVLMFSFQSPKERLFVGLFFIILAIITSWNNWILWLYGGADNVFLVQLANNIANRGVPYSQVALAVRDMFALILGNSAEMVCQLPLEFSLEKEFNYFSWHTYLYLYLLSPLHWFLDARHTLPVLTALSFVGLLLFTFNYLRYKEVPVALSLIVVFMIMMHPAWLHSISGQLYSDRFYLIFGFPLLVFLYEKPNKTFAIVFLGLMAALISERFGAIVGAQLLYFSFLPLLKRKRPNLRLFLMGVCFVGFTVFILLNFIEYSANSSFSKSLTPAYFLKNYATESFRYGFYTFLLVTFCGIGFFSFFKPTLFPLLLINIFPNMIGNLGGAEKTGFLTHYHSAYFPILVFVSVAGFINVCRFLEKRNHLKSIYFMLLLSGIIHAGVVSSRIDSFRVSNDLFNGYLSPIKGVRLWYNGTFSYFKHMIWSAGDNIPEGAKVVTTEFALPFIARNTEVSLVPLGLANADYAFLPVVNEPGEPGVIRFGGSFSYLGIDDTIQQDDCINEHLQKYDYDITNVQRFGRWALIKRIPDNNIMKEIE
jgi:hypothetical protein